MDIEDIQYLEYIEDIEYSYTLPPYKLSIVLSTSISVQIDKLFSCSFRLFFVDFPKSFNSNVTVY